MASSYPYNLDLLVYQLATRQEDRIVVTPGLDYHADDNVRSANRGSVTQPGAWAVAGVPSQTMSEDTAFAQAALATELILATPDADGVAIPDGATPETILWTTPNGQTAVFNVASESFFTDSGPNPSANHEYQLTPPHDLTGDETIGAGAGRQTFGIGASQTVESIMVTDRTPFWAARRDFRARDQLEIAAFSGGAILTIDDVRFIVRADVGSWSVGLVFEDDDGNSRRVEGMAKLDRGRFLELLARQFA